MEIVPKAYAVNIGEIFGPAKNFQSFGALISTILPNIFLVAGIVFFIMIVYAGIQMIAAGSNDPEKMKKLGATLTSSVIGLLIIVLAYVIVKIIFMVTGFQNNPNL